MANIAAIRRTLIDSLYLFAEGVEFCFARDGIGGDGTGGCVDPKTTMGYGISHLIVNLVVTPTSGGAVGKSYLLAIGVGGDPTKIERQGGYDDVYVKTAAGWRFKSRIHVFPNMSESVQFGRGRRGQPPPALPSAQGQ